MGRLAAAPYESASPEVTRASINLSLSGASARLSRAASMVRPTSEQTCMVVRLALFGASSRLAIAPYHRIAKEEARASVNFALIGANKRLEATLAIPDGTVRGVVKDIEESHLRMQKARLRVEVKVKTATTKIQATERGRQCRKMVDLRGKAAAVLQRAVRRLQAQK